MPATRLTLIAHASTQARKRTRFALDEPLETEGQQMPLAQAKRFKRAPRLLCGPELRTRQTAPAVWRAPAGRRGPARL